MKKLFNIAARTTLGLFLAASAVLCIGQYREARSLAGADPAGRVMTTGEIAMAREVFGGTIDYSTVRLHKAPALGDMAVTQGNDIYFEFATLQGKDLSAPTEGPSKKGTLMHELTHVWQNQSPATLDTLLRTLRTLPGRFAYALTGNTSGYHYDRHAGKNFTAMNEEQQGMIAADYVTAKETLKLPLCVEAGPHDEQNIVCHGSRILRDSLAQRLTPALPMPGAAQK